MSEYGPPLMILLGVASLVLRKSLVEWRRRLLGLDFTASYRRRLELLQIFVGIALIGFGVLIGYFGS